MTKFHEDIKVWTDKNHRFKFILIIGNSVLIILLIVLFIVGYCDLNKKFYSRSIYIPVNTRTGRIVPLPEDVELWRYPTDFKGRDTLSAAIEKDSVPPSENNKIVGAK